MRLCSAHTGRAPLFQNGVVAMGRALAASVDVAGLVSVEVDVDVEGLGPVHGL